MKPGDDKKQEQQQKEAHKTRRQGNQTQEKELEQEEKEKEEEEEENLVERRSQEAKEVRAASRQVILLPTYIHIICTYNNIKYTHKYTECTQVCDCLHLAI